MRLVRLQLKNWRGVEEREIGFSEKGVTIVKGPNESGKSSMIEAIDVLIEHYDDTKKREVVAVKPVHKDAGAEVEAEIHTAQYQFTYGKRFHRRSETRLAVTRPVPENLTGRDAHERARTILDETVDLALWSALRIEQGQEVTQANLSQQKSLSAALDRAAGVARFGDTEETLYEAARAERDRYFTPTGHPRKETTELEAEVARLENELTGINADLAKLEADIEHSAQLDRELVEAQRAAIESEELLKKHDERLREIKRLEERVRELKASFDAASASSKEAERLEAERRSLVEDARNTAEESAKQVAGDDLTAPAFNEAQVEQSASGKAFAASVKAVETAEAVAAISKQDCDFRKEDFDLHLLKERKTRIDKADEAAKQAEATLARNNVADDVLRKFQKAHIEVEVARGALTAGSPELRIHALTDIAATIEGRPRPLARGEKTKIPVPGSLSIILPGIAEMEISTGSSNTNLRDDFEAKTRKFAEVCRAVGVESLDQATAANAAWQAAMRDVEQRDRVIAADLRDLTREKISQKIAELEQRVASYPGTRVADFELPHDLDAAQDALRGANAAADAARKARDAAEQRREAARRRIDSLKEERAKVALAREGAKTRAAVAAVRLEQARARKSDEDVSRALQMAQGILRTAERTYQAESTHLATEQPSEARILAENALAAKRATDERLRMVENGRIAVRERLKERGEAGLAERADATNAKLGRVADTLKRRRIHAAAAKLLFDSLDQERANARRAYVAPLRTEIEKLGRVVYGPTFSVDLNEETLQIANRTLNGRTVPFESLSGGAKEQLGVITRLACALTVAPDGGVPVMFDDTLGSTDPGRIEAMCALLALAGRQCQVIVLTCVPDRFRHIGGAHIVEVS